MAKEDEGRDWLDWLLWGMLTAVAVTIAYQRGEAEGLRSAPEYVAYEREADDFLRQMMDSDCPD